MAPEVGVPIGILLPLSGASGRIGVVEWAPITDNSSGTSKHPTTLRPAKTMFQPLDWLPDHVERQSFLHRAKDGLWKGACIGPPPSTWRGGGWVLDGQKWLTGSCTTCKIRTTAPCVKGRSYQDSCLAHAFPFLLRSLNRPRWSSHVLDLLSFFIEGFSSGSITIPFISGKAVC
jgi:hypothetical protein